MKRFILSIISLAAVMTLGTMPSYLAYAASKSIIGTSTSSSSSTSSSTSSSKPKSTSSSKSVITTGYPVINNVKVDGTVTIFPDDKAGSVMNGLARSLHQSSLPSSLLSSLNPSDLLGSSGLVGSKQSLFSVERPLHTIVNLERDPTKGIYKITVTKVSIPWFVGTGFSIPNGKVGHGIFRPSTNAVNMTIPIQMSIPKDTKTNVSQS